MMAGPVKSILFDLDDTLFDHRGSSLEALEVVRQEHPSLRERPLEEVARHFFRLIDEGHLQVLMGRLTLEEARTQRFRQLFQLYGEALTQEQAARLAQRYRTVYQQVRRPVAGAAALLKQLKGRVKIGVVTNNLYEEQRDKLRHCKLDLLIDFLVTSERAGAMKPSAAIFRLALERSGCQAQEAVMVGDSWEADVLGAHGAGIRPVWFNRWRLPCPDPTIARELCSFSPLEEAHSLLLGEGDERGVTTRRD